MKFTDNFGKYFRQAIGTLVVTICVCVLVAKLCFSWAFLNPVAGALDAISFTDNCMYIENNREEPVDVNMDVAFISLAGVDSRLEIATHLQRICDLHPRVVGMDCIFGPNALATQEENDSLKRVISRLDNFVSAQRIVKSGDGFSVESSFYKDVCYNASVNIEDNIVRHFSPDSVTVGDTTLPSFVGEILRLGYPETYQMLKERNNEEELINYKKLQFDMYNIRDNFDEFDIEDRIILIGDYDDLRDYHTIATELDGTRRICGTLIHIYSITTATKADRLVTIMDDVMALLIGVLITILFNYFCCWAYEAYEKTNGMIINFTQMGFLLVMMLATGLTYINYRYSINFLYAMIGVGLGGFSSELWLFIESLPWYIWLRNKFPTLLGKY